MFDGLQHLIRAGFSFPPQGWMTSHCRCTSLTRRKFTAIWPHQYLGVIQYNHWLTNTHFQTTSLISLKMVMIHSTKKIDNDLAGRKLEVAYGQWNKKHACTRRCVHYNTRHFLSKINLKKEKIPLYNRCWRIILENIFQVVNAHKWHDGSIIKKSLTPISFIRLPKVMHTPYSTKDIYKIAWLC